MSILVVGAGFVGGNVIRILHERGMKVVGFDVTRPGPNSVLWNYKDEIEFEIGNLVDLSHLLRVVKDHKIEGIIHTAAITGNTNNKRPVDALRINVEGTVNVLEAVRIMGLRRAVCCSSGSAAGICKDLKRRVLEDDPPVMPLDSMYAVFKLADEGMIYNYQALFGTSVIACRPSRVWGPGSPPERGKVHCIQYLINEAVAGRSVEMPSGSDTPIDYTYVKDEAEGLIQTYMAKAPKHSLYNMSFGDLRTPVQMAEVLKKVFPKLNFKIGPGVWPGWVGTDAAVTGPDYQMSLRAALDITRARTDLGYKPHDLDKTIPDYVRWLQNKEWVLPERM
jgi:UDP-glucose 4-epimerase